MNDEQNYNDDIEYLAQKASQLHTYSLAYLVDFLESAPGGSQAVEKNPDKKPYAALKPTHDEYLERFKALLEYADDDTRRRWKEQLCFFLPIALTINVLGDYKLKDHITPVAFNDLLERLTELAGLTDRIALYQQKG